QQVVATASCRSLVLDLARRGKAGEAAKADRAEKTIAGGIAAGSDSPRQADGRAAAREQIGDRLSVHAQHAAVYVDHQSALGMKQSWHDTADVKRADEWSESEIAPTEGIGLFTARGPVIVVHRRRNGRGIEPMDRRECLRRVGLLHAAIVRKFDELFLRRRDVEDPLIENRETRATLRHHVRRVAGISGALIAEAMARAIDDDPALLDRGP